MSNLLVPEGVPAWAWAALAREDGQRWAIPERDASGEVIGTAFRLPDGRKSFARGGKRGLIFAADGPPAYAGTSDADPVFVAEGASDTAALMGLSLDAVGVAMAGACAEMVAEKLVGLHAVLVAHADEAGRRGARKIAEALLPRCASVKLIEPPDGAKDARAAVIAGANRDSFLALAKAAKPLQTTPARLDGEPVLVPLAQVQPESVAWLWPGRIALGKLTLIAGDPGLGKSFTTLDVAARVSRGAAWPDAPDASTTPGGVVLLSAEDGVADTIRPRLDAAGADVSRIVALEAVRSVGSNGRESARAFDLSRDLPALEAAIKAVDGCRLVVIDPVTAYLGGVDSHKNAEIRGLLAPLAALAAKHNLAIVAVTHLNKAQGGPAIYRSMGSLAFAAAARAAWVVTKDKDDPARRLLLPVKNNLAPDVGGLAYRIGPVGVRGAPAVAWEPDPVSLTADEALAGDRGEACGRTERDDAADWLREFLADGPRPAADVEREAREAGFTFSTLRRAKAAIGVKSLKQAFGGHWEWALRPEDAQPPRMRSDRCSHPDE